MKAMILAAGFGKRLRPLTDRTPKALIEIGGKPLLQIVIDQLSRFGFRDLAINVHHHAQQVISFIEDHYDKSSDIVISHEKTLLDTGGGIKRMAAMLGASEPILVYNVDILSTIDLEKVYHYHLRSKAAATLVTQQRTSSSYLIMNKEKQLCGLGDKNKNIIRCVDDCSREVNFLGFCGIQVISPSIFSDYPGTKFYSIDVYLDCAEKGQKIGSFSAQNSYWRDIGTHESLRQAERDIAEGLFTPFPPHT